MGVVALVVGLVVGVVACEGTEESVASPTVTDMVDVQLVAPTPTPHIQVLINPIWYVSPSIDEQILTSKVIVVASLQSVTAATEAVSSGKGVASTYIPLQKLKFKSHEYLKGTGPQEFVVEVRGEHTYLTQVEAKQAADRTVSGRNTTWDKRQAVLFLQGPLTPAVSGGESGSSSTKSYEFTTSNPIVQSEWDYSVDTLSRAWLPAKESAEGSSGNRGVVHQPRVHHRWIQDDTTNHHPHQAPYTDIRDRRHVEGWQGGRIHVLCIFQANSRAAFPGSHLHAINKHIYSIFPARLQDWRLKEELGKSIRSRSIRIFWVGGTDANLFQAKIIDDDADPSNRYDHALVTTRPLPKGTYRVSYNLQHYDWVPCNFKPIGATFENWTITVTVPTGTVHEAFFDPASTSLGVGFQGSQGTLSPASFTHGEVSSSITSLGWEDGKVTLILSPYVSLAGKTLDVIELDGTVSLALAFDDGSVDRTAGTVGVGGG